jgi:4-amino-4-deoxy-L-arabinose transferase-like glycosyltransferase
MTSHELTTSSDRRARGNEAVGLALALGAALLLLVLAWPRITAPFGDSDEGINGAVWATNSRALREAGPWTSKLGGERLDGTEYATHPPFIVVSTALAETIGGEHEWASRAPAWLASLAAIGLLYALLRGAGVGPPAAGAAAAATALTPMFFTYGFMLDTPVVSLPFGVAVLLLWFAQWRAPAGARAWHPAAIAAVCALAALAGWQAAVLVGLAGLTLVVRGHDDWRRALTDALPFLAGGAVGLGLSLSWSWWVYGDFSTLSDKFFRRSGESNSVGVGDMVSFQIPWLTQLLGLGLVGFGGCVAALWDRRFRPLAATGLAIVVVYAVAFRQAAAGHQYWNYWALVPCAIGFGWLFDRVARDLRARAVLPTLVGVCALIAIINLAVLDDDARRYVDDGHEVAELVVDQSFPDDQRVVPYLGQPYRPDAWLAYYTDRSPRVLSSSDQLDAMVAERPDDIVVVLGWCDDDPGAALCRSVVGPDPSTADHYQPPRPWVGPASQTPLAGR